MEEKYILRINRQGYIWWARRKANGLTFDANIGKFDTFSKDEIDFYSRNMDKFYVDYFEILKTTDEEVSVIMSMMDIIL